MKKVKKNLKFDSVKNSKVNVELISKKLKSTSKKIKIQPKVIRSKQIKGKASKKNVIVVNRKTVSKIKKGSKSARKHE